MMSQMDSLADKTTVPPPPHDSWQPTPGELSPSRSRWLLARRLGSIAVVLVLFGIMLSELLSLKRYVPVVAVFGSGYELPWGPIPMTHEDRGLLESLSRSPAGIFQPKVVTWLDASEDLFAESPQEFVATFVSRVAAIRPGGPSKDTVVAYLSCVGTLDAEGRACLVPPRISDGEAVAGVDRLISVSSLLQRLRDAVAPGVKLVVVLDACHGGLAWPLGLTEGGFPVAVQATFNTLQPANTWVVLPAAAGEVSQGDEAVGASCFARFFTRGIEGAADQAVSGDGDGVVDLAELMRYLSREVQRFSASVYGVRQTPQMLPATTDGATPQLAWAREPVTDLSLGDAVAEASGESAEPESAAAAASAGSTADWWLEDRWMTAEAIRGSAVHQRPRVWQQYQRLLVRAESLRTMGVAAQQELGEVEVLTERLELELISRNVANPQYLASLRLQPQVSADDFSRDQGEIPKWVEELKAAVFRADAKPIPAKSTSYVTVDLWNRRADAAWQWLMTRVEAGGRVDAKMMTRWLDKLGTTGGAIEAEPTQIHAARMLLRELSPHVWNAGTDLPMQLLRQVGRSREACFPIDVRADRLVTLLSPRDEVDRDLRRAIDLAVVGDEASLSESKSLVATVDQALNRILDVGQQVSSAYQTSDDYFDELPWLVAWLAREQRVAVVSGSAAASEQLQLSANAIDWQATIDTVARFQRVVAESPMVAVERLAEKDLERERLAEEILERVRQSADAAEKAVAPLRDVFDAVVDELTSSAPESGVTLGRIERVLDTPLVRGQRRLRLLERAGRLRQQLRQQVFTEADTDEAVEPPSSEAAMAAWTTWHDQDMHPVVPVLASKIDGVGQRPIQVGQIAMSLGRQLAAVRNEVGQLPQSMADLERQAMRIEAEIPTITKGQLRATKRVESLLAISAGAPSWRRLACILGMDDMAAPSPVRKSLLAAWHDRLLAAANDALDDYWAAEQPQAPVWCFAAARGFLEKAEEVNREALIEHGAVARRDLRIRLRQLESGSQFSSAEGDFGVLQLDPRVIRVSDNSRLLNVLSDSPPNIAILTPEVGVPTGLASLRFAETNMSKALPLAAAADGSATERLPLPVGTQKNPGILEWQIHPDATTLFRDTYSPASDTPLVIDAIASFRGHRLVTAAPLAMGSAIRLVEWQSVATAPPRVMVRGDIPRNRAVALVFDCSGSMGQRLPDGRTRLEAGRSALYEVLETIARDGGWSVSVWLYGHRTRWKRNDRGEFQAELTDAGKAAEKQVLTEGRKFSLLPGDDIEQVMRLQPLVPLQVARIRSIVDAVKPGGETPLYLAINEALQTDFGAGNPGPAHVLVVTDGANDQSGGRITTSSDVRRTLSQVNFRRSEQDQVRIDVVGFDLEPGVYDRQIRLQDVQSVAADSRGRFFDAGDAQGLTEALKSSLDIQKWRVQATTGEQLISVGLNQQVELPQPIPGTSPTYDVALESVGGGLPRRVSVSGGEGLELFVSGGGSGLEFRRYDGGLEQGLRDASTNLPDPISPDRRWFLGAHLARRQGSTVVFPVSFQNGDADGFSPRPAEMWIELQPMGAAGPYGQPYVFTDPLFQPGRPVPVLDLVAKDWPPEATAAEIRCWLRLEQAVPEVAIPVSSLAPGVEQVLELPAFPGSRVRVRAAPLTSPTSLFVTVIEEHPRERAASLPTLRVGISRTCTRAVHITVPDTGRVRHEFTVALVDEQVASDVMLTVTDRRAIQRDSIGPPAPGSAPQALKVGVPPR